MEECRPKSLLVSLFLIALPLLPIGCSQREQPRGQEPGSSTVLESSEGPSPITAPNNQRLLSKPVDFSTTVEAIMKEFSTDKDTAIKKYNGKVVEVEGVLADPHLGDPSDQPYVRFQTDPSPPVLTCFLNRVDGQRTYSLTVGVFIHGSKLPSGSWIDSPAA
jgi:hypothetical protein